MSGEGLLSNYEPGSAAGGQPPRSSAAEGPRTPDGGAGPRNGGGCWADAYVKRVNDAKLFLSAAGCWVERVKGRANSAEDATLGPSSNHAVTEWRVAGYSGRFSNEQLVALARAKGMRETDG